MEVVAPKMKYFVTPTQNIVRGVVEGGKVTNAEFFVNKRNEYSTPSQLNQLMKERTNLSLGKIELKEVSRPNFTDYDIPIDAGKPKKKPKMSEELDAGKKKKPMRAGAVEATEEDIEAGRRRRRPMKAGAVEATEEDIEAGKRGRSKSRSKKIDAGAVEDIEAGKKKKSSSKPAKRSKSVKRSRSKSRSKKIDAGAVTEKRDEKRDEKITLAELFKHVSLNLANQTSNVIARGGNPAELLKEDIKFFSKQ